MFRHNLFIKIKTIRTDKKVSMFQQRIICNTIKKNDVARVAKAWQGLFVLSICKYIYWRVYASKTNNKKEELLMEWTDEHATWGRYTMLKCMLLVVYYWNMRFYNIMWLDYVSFRSRYWHSAMIVWPGNQLR